MTYYVVLSFDLHNPLPGQYEKVAEELKAVGFHKRVTGGSGKWQNLPATTFVGKFTGETAGTIRTDLSDRVRDLFEGMGLRSKILLVVGGDWAWGIRNT